MTTDTYHVVLWDVHMRRIDRVVETFAGGPEARDDAVGLAGTLNTLRDQLTMLGVTFSAPYAIRVQQVRRGPASGLYGVQRKRFLGIDDAPADAEEEARFWADDPEESVRRTITDGAERLDRAAAYGEGATIT